MGSDLMRSESEDGPALVVRGRRRVSLVAAVQSLEPYLGETGARIYMLQELASETIIGCAASLYMEHTFLGPIRPLVVENETVPSLFWCFEWAHDGEITQFNQDGRCGYPDRTSIHSDWAASSFSFVMTYGAPGRRKRICQRAVNVSITKSDHAAVLSLFHSTGDPRLRPVSHEDVLRWCVDWLASGRGQNNASAYAQFAADPRFDDVAREAFRAAWAQAKAMKNG